MKLSKALEAVQLLDMPIDCGDVGIKLNSTDGELIHSFRGIWYEDRILEYLDKDADAINISIGQDEYKIMAIYTIK